MMSVEDLGWMAGSWRCEIWGGVFEETWSLPAPDGMIGMGRHLREGKTTFTEAMSIQPDGEGGLIMWILTSRLSAEGLKAKPFQLQEQGPGFAVFARPPGDFPTTIRYERMGEDSMLCLLEGEGRSERFGFVRR